MHTVKHTHTVTHTLSQTHSPTVKHTHIHAHTNTHRVSKGRCNYLVILEDVNEHATSYQRHFHKFGGRYRGLKGRGIEGLQRGGGVPRAYRSTNVVLDDNFITVKIYLMYIKLGEDWISESSKIYCVWEWSTIMFTDWLIYLHNLFINTSNFVVSQADWQTDKQIDIHKIRQTDK